MTSFILYFSILFLLFTTLSSSPMHFSEAQNSTNIQNDTHQIYVPATISKEAQEELRKLTSNAFLSFTVPDSADFNGWKKIYREFESMTNSWSQPLIDNFRPSITKSKLGGVIVFDIKPENWRDNGKVLVYTHGGGYTLLSANSTLSSSILAANATGLRVVSVDYTVAPFSKWNQTTDQVISVIQALKDEQGYSLNSIAIYGDSAGGGLAAGTVLKMRDKGIGMPAAVVLWSPWTDVTQNGDTYFTLMASDPLLTNNLFLKNSADAYANSTDHKNPYVSPVYGDFSKGFPPTLIQGGTKEILVSDFVRLYQALDQADVPVKLDIYEGMPHVFQYILMKTPESDISLSKMNDFLRMYLKY